MKIEFWPGGEPASREILAMKSGAVNDVDGQEQGTGTKFPAESNSWFLWLAWRETRSQSPVLQRVAMKSMAINVFFRQGRGIFERVPSFAVCGDECSILLGVGAPFGG
jgi:hypothetical protein